MKSRREQAIMRSWRWKTREGMESGPEPGRLVVDVGKRCKGGAMIRILARPNPLRIDFRAHKLIGSHVNVTAPVLEQCLRV